MVLFVVNISEGWDMTNFFSIYLFVLSVFGNKEIVVILIHKIYYSN